MRNATDKLGRSVTIIPDDIAVELREASHAGWHEYVGMADGHSREYAPGTRVHGLVTDLFTWWRANGGHTCLIVGESGWDDAASWWAQSPNHHGLDMRYHVSAMPCHTGDGAVRFCG
jgi:hypothetical protein